MSLWYSHQSSGFGIVRLYLASERSTFDRLLAAFCEIWGSNHVALAQALFGGSPFGTRQTYLMLFSRGDFSPTLDII